MDRPIPRVPFHAVEALCRVRLRPSSSFLGGGGASFVADPLPAFVFDRAVVGKRAGEEKEEAVEEKPIRCAAARDTRNERVSLPRGRDSLWHYVFLFFVACFAKRRVVCGPA